MSASLKVSVVTPTFRRNHLLLGCLGALAVQDLAPDEYEVIIVDDAADPGTAELVHRFAERCRVSVRYLAAAGRGPAAARNLGWRSARAPVIAFTDDDCIPTRSWLREGLAAMDHASACSGRLVLPVPETPTDYERNAAHLADAEFVTANCFYRVDALERAGGFDERFTAAWREDSDLYFSVLQNHGVCRRAPDAVVIHPIRPARWGISLSQQRKNVFNALLFKKHPQLYRERVQARPPYLYYGAVLAMALSLVAWALEWPGAGAGFAAWALLTALFCVRRLRGNSRSPSHVAEMVVTSVLIPPLAVFWRVAGAIRYRVFFL